MFDVIIVFKARLGVHSALVTLHRNNVLYSEGKGQDHAQDAHEGTKSCPIA